MWCVAHRLELSAKDALKGICFDFVDDNRSSCFMCMKDPQRSVGSLAYLKKFLLFDDLHKTKVLDQFKLQGHVGSLTS